MSTSRKHNTGFLVKSLLREYGIEGSLFLAVKSLYSCSEICVCVGKVKSRPFTVGVGLRQGCVLSLLFSSRSASAVTKLRTVGRIRPADQFNRTSQISCKIFSSATLPTVDSSATASTAACHVNHTVSGPPVARQSRIRPSGQNVWPPLEGLNEVSWRPGQEASLAPQCSNLRCFGSKCTALKKV